MKKAQTIVFYGFLGLFLFTPLTWGQVLNTANRMMQDEDRLSVGAALWADGKVRSPMTCFMG